MFSPNYALRHLGQDNASYSSECVEEKFSEVRGSKVGQPLPYLGHRAGVLTLWPFIHERRGIGILGSSRPEIVAWHTKTVLLEDVV